MPMDRPTRIADMTSEKLATNFVGMLIEAKGNLNRYGSLTEMLVREVRVSNSLTAADEALLRKVVDLTFGYANEDESVPSGEVATKIIERAMAALATAKSETPASRSALHPAKGE